LEIFRFKFYTLIARSYLVVVVMTSPSGTAYMGGQKYPEEMRKSTRL